MQAMDITRFAFRISRNLRYLRHVRVESFATGQKPAFRNILRVLQWAKELMKLEIPREMVNGDPSVNGYRPAPMAQELKQLLEALDIRRRGDLRENKSPIEQVLSINGRRGRCDQAKMHEIEREVKKQLKHIIK